MLRREGESFYEVGIGDARSMCRVSPHSRTGLSAHKVPSRQRPSSVRAGLRRVLLERGNSNVECWKAPTMRALELWRKRGEWRQCTWTARHVLH